MISVQTVLQTAVRGRVRGRGPPPPRRRLSLLQVSPRCCLVMSKRSLSHSTSSMLDQHQHQRQRQQQHQQQHQHQHQQQQKQQQKRQYSESRDEDQDQPPNSILTWELSKEQQGHATIHLQPYSSSSSSLSSPAVPVPVPVPGKSHKSSSKLEQKPESTPLIDDAAAKARAARTAAAEAAATAEVPPTIAGVDPDADTKEGTEGNKGTEGDAVVVAAVVPRTVLQYERQVRKAQHAKKAGLILTKDQLSIVFQDEHMLVTNKPPGVLTVPGVRSHSSLLDLVHHQIFGSSTAAASAAAAASTTAAASTADTATAADNSTSATDAQQDTTTTTTTTSIMDKDKMIVHRLDMDTSGLVLFSLNLDITKLLHAAFASRKVEKEYDAVLMGHLPVEIDTALLDLPLQRDHEHPPFMRVATDKSEAEAAAVLIDLHAHGWKKLTKKRPKPSQTELRVVERGWKRFPGVVATTSTTSTTINTESGTAAGGSLDGTNDDTEEQLLPFTRVRLTPITGRTHQLRVHCAALGFPIVGDPTYSLYGEAAPVGGLQDCSVAAVVAAPSSEPADTSNDDDIKSKNETMTSLLLKSRPSLDMQKAWTAAHPPNVEPMCLHAAMLQIHHPVTGELLTWEVPAAF
jgi:tRNA pseudouridine32 synthase/23S rRNA pseudouridine746 synthase